MLAEIIENFAHQKVLVVGDLMIDAYFWGDVDRISPEAPIPVVAVKEQEYRLGGAANVALNTVSLGAETAMLALTGEDLQADRVFARLNEQGINADYMIRDANRRTTVKTRVISKGQHLLRIDEEDLFDASQSICDQALEAFNRCCAEFKPNVVILEDYNKGFLTPRLIEGLIATAQQFNIPVTVDPKLKNFDAYKGVDMFKPNLKELCLGLKIQVDPKNYESLKTGVESLQKRINCKSAFLTLSEYGVFGLAPDFVGQIPAHPRKILDVSGAGDTVISIASLALATGAPSKAIFALSNLGGGLVCEEVGVVPINKSRLLEEAKKIAL